MSKSNLPTTPQETAPTVLPWTRRRLLQTALAAGVAAGSALVVAACGGSRDRAEPDGAAAEQARGVCGEQNISLVDSARVRALDYVDQSPQPGQSCSTCRLFHPEGNAGGCGKCDALPIQVAATGWCRAYTAA